MAVERGLPIWVYRYTWRDAPPHLLSLLENLPSRLDTLRQHLLLAAADEVDGEA